MLRSFPNGHKCPIRCGSCKTAVVVCLSSINAKFVVKGSEKVLQKGTSVCGSHVNVLFMRHNTTRTAGL